MRKCPKCEHEQEDTAAICTYCGTLLNAEDEFATTRALGNTDYEEGVPHWGAANFNDRMNLVITVRGEAGSFVYDADQVDEIVIGRYDPGTSNGPDLDLRDYGAAEMGVSRRHAAIIRRDGALRIVDRSSPNGTFLNGQRLIADQPRILRDGDHIRLGHLVLHVQFERAVSSEK